MSTKKKNERVFETPQEEIKFLKRQVAGLKGQISTISNEKEKWKDYFNEADELNEKRIAEIDDLKATSCAKDETIECLESTAKSLKEIITERDDTIKKLIDCTNALKDQLEYYKPLPWYKRIFFKG